MGEKPAFLLAAGLLLVAASFTPAEAKRCPPGKSKTADTNGVCCWSGQAAGADKVCVGVPDFCPDGFILDEPNQTCVVAACPEGMERSSKSAPCCFPGQAWSRSKNQCIGKVKKCPAGLTPKGDSCVDPQSTAHETNVSRCLGGDRSACFQAAYSHGTGEGTWKDPGRAWRYYKTSCDRGSVDACTNMGLYYQSGSGVKKNLARAQQLYQSGCNAGDGEGCYFLGNLYRGGTGVTADPARARQLFDQACKKAGGPRGWRGCNALADMYQRGQGGAKDLAKAREIVKGACMRIPDDTGLNCGTYGYMQVVGTGGPKEVSRGLEHLRWACDKGAHSRCYLAGYYDLIGAGWVSVNYSRARRYLDKACRETGNCWAIAYMLARGLGGPADLAAARRLLPKACSSPNRGAACLAADVITLDHDPKNATAAASRIRDYCTQGLGYACWVLADAMHERKLTLAAIDVLNDSCAKAKVRYPVDCYMAADRLLKVGDRDAAMQTFGTACQLGHSRACERKKTIAGEIARHALKQDQQLCRQGRVDSCYTMAQRHIHGRDVPRDEGMVRNYLERACSLHKSRTNSRLYYGQRACADIERLDEERRRRLAAAAAAAEAEKVRKRQRELSSVESSRDERRFEEYIERYDGTPEADQARHALKELRAKTLRDNRAARDRWLREAAEYDDKASSHKWKGVGLVTLDLALLGGGIALIVLSDELLLDLPGYFAVGWGLGDLLFAKRYSRHFRQASHYSDTARGLRKKARALEVMPMVTPRSAGFALRLTF